MSVRQLVHRRELVRYFGLAALGACGWTFAACLTGPPSTAPAATATPASAPVPPTSAATTGPVANPTPPPPAPAKATAAPTVAAKPPRANMAFAMPAPSFGSGPGYIAKARGFFDEQNLNVDVQTVAANTTIQQGLVSGEFDATEADSSNNIAATANGGDVKILAAFAPGHSMAIVAKKEISSLADLAGRPIASGQPGSFPYVTFQALFELAGLDMNRSVLVPLGGTPARVQALLEGQVDATCINLDTVPTALKDPNLKLLIIAREKLPNYLSDSINVNGKLLRDRPEVAVRFAMALAKATRSIIDDPDETVKAMAALMKLEPAVMAQVRKQYVDAGNYDPDGRVSPAQIDYMQELNVRFGAQKQKLSFDQIVDAAVLERALAAIGPYRKR